MKTNASLQPDNNRELTHRLRPPSPRPKSKRKQSKRQLRTMLSRQKGGVSEVLRGVPPEAPRSEQLLTMKQVKEQALERLPAPWWVEQSKRKPTKHPSSKQRRPLPNNSRKLKQRPHTNKVSTHSSDHSLHVWTLADTRFSDNPNLGPD